MNLATIPWDKLSMGAIAVILGLYFLVKEVLPVYFKSKGNNNSNLPASKGDVQGLVQRVDKLEETMGEIRDWVIGKQAIEEHSDAE